MKRMWNLAPWPALEVARARSGGGGIMLVPMLEVCEEESLTDCEKDGENGAEEQTSNCLLPGFGVRHMRKATLLCLLLFL